MGLQRSDGRFRVLTSPISSTGPCEFVEQMNEGLPCGQRTGTGTAQTGFLPSRSSVSLGKILLPNVMNSYFFNKGKDGEEKGTLGYRCSVNSPKKSHSKDAQHI